MTDKLSKANLYSIVLQDDFDRKRLRKSVAYAVTVEGATLPSNAALSKALGYSVVLQDISGDASQADPDFRPIYRDGSVPYLEFDPDKYLVANFPRGGRYTLVVLRPNLTFDPDVRVNMDQGVNELRFEGDVAQFRYLRGTVSEEDMADIKEEMLSFYNMEPPVLDTAPEISGLFEVGQELTCSEGIWEHADSITFQWLRDGVEIAGETSDTYELVVEDIGAEISCRVTASNDFGSTPVVAEGEEVVFDPLVSYANGEQGAYYAPWDISTLWQDEERTVPVENYGDPVRVMDDLSPNGNHAVAPTSAARGTYGRMPAGVGRRNMANHSEEPTIWGSAGCEITSAGDLGALVTVTSSGESGAEVTPVERMLGFVKYRIWVAESDSEWLYVNTTRQTGGQRRAWVSLKTLEVHPATHSDYSEISAEVDGEFIRVDLVINTAFDGEAYPRLYRLSASGEGGVLPSVGDSVYVKKVDIRYLDQDGPYQRVGNQYDVSQEGVPDVYYIETDGIDDCYQTESIDLTMYDSTSLISAVQWLGIRTSGSDVLFEDDGASNTNAFALITRNSNRDWIYRSAGTAINSVIPSAAVLDNNPHVLSLSASISEPRLDWGYDSLSGTSSESQGTGTWRESAWNLFCRNKTSSPSLFWEGRFMGLIMVVPESPYEEQNRQFLAKKAGVTL